MISSTPIDIREFFAQIPETDDSDTSSHDILKGYDPLFDHYYFSLCEKSPKKKECPICNKRLCDHDAPGEGELVGVCQVCGKVFLAHRRTKKYCCVHCRRIANGDMRMPEVRECAICGKLYDSKRKDTMYCSRACKQKATRIRAAMNGR